MPLITGQTGLTGRMTGRASEGTAMLRRAYSALPKISEEQTSKIRSAREKAKLCESKADSIEKLKAASEKLLRISGSLDGAEEMNDGEFIDRVKLFVDSYNETAGAIASSDRFVGSGGAGLDAVTASYSKALEKAGIVTAENGLAVDDDVISRSTGAAKKLFGNRFFYGSRIAQKASLLLDMTRKAENKTGIYDRTGTPV